MKKGISNLFFLLLIVFSIAIAHSHDHGHSHSHSHSHSHEHKQKDQIGQKHKSISIPKWMERDQVTIWRNAIGATLLVGVLPIFILFLVPINGENTKSGSGKDLLNVLLSFACGGLLGDVFLHLLPHSKSSSDSGSHGHSHSHDGGGDHDHSGDIITGLWVLLGFTSFFAIEKYLKITGKGGHSHSHSHSHSDKKNDDAKEPKVKKADQKGSVLLNLVADFTHNFTDGLAIGTSFLISDAVGIVTTITIFFHEIPHEIGDFAVLIRKGKSRKEAMLFQLVTAIGAVIGTVASLLANNLVDTTLWVLPFTAGGFIYIATVTIIPSLLEEDSSFGQMIKELFGLGIGIGMMVIIGLYE
eukprot:TRINITY_DN9258_c0_g1_i1.p1 TRINITY_DN9258_c0_g1~~TRINITY_DN9258_c0_g1_i1.p1  ORF type:complete len:356 (-),score=84.46 TRINITY_DN9258_c0_g1_i1:70-1137(-)